MSKSPKLFAAALGLCLLSATGVTLAAAHAEMFEAGAALPARPVTSSILENATPQPAATAEAQPAAPAVETAPSSVQAPAPAPRGEPVPAPVRRTAAVDAELTCLARVILYEAGAEPRSGQVAVAQVVMNRVRSPRFPNTICGVVNQPGQFSAIRRFHPPRDARWRRALAIAREARDGTSAPVVGRALYFHARHVRPGFARSRVRVAAIGGHVFYR